MLSADPGGCSLGYDGEAPRAPQMVGVVAVSYAARSPIEPVQFVTRGASVAAEGVKAGGLAAWDDSEGQPVDIAREVQRLAASAIPQEEIACRLGIALAEVRLLMAMQTARVSRRGALGRLDVALAPDGETGEDGTAKGSDLKKARDTP